MNFIEKTRACNLGTKMAPAVLGYLLGAASALSLLLGAEASMAQATTDPSPYVGIWEMTAQDKRVGTLELMNHNGRLTGTLTNAHATMDSNGKLVEFDAIPGAAPIVETSISQGVLVLSIEETDEAILTWNMTLAGEGKGLLQLAVKGHEMKPFQITKIPWEQLESEVGK